MKLPIPRIWKIEKEILELKRKLAEEENDAFKELCKKVDLENLESSIRMVVSDRRLEIELLDLERGFILDRQKGLIWRIVWNVLIPIVVTIITAWALVTFGLK